MNNTIKRLTILTAALFSMGTLTACNTMEGAGKDIEAAGDKLEDTASEYKSY